MTEYEPEENLQVNTSKYTNFSGKIHKFYNFRETFESTCDAAGLGIKILYFNTSEEDKYLDKSATELVYNLKVTKLFRILKKATATGTSMAK